jgi:hypothetical protein
VELLTKFKQGWLSIPPISTKQNKVLTGMVNNSTNINKTKESLNRDGQQSTNINKTKESLNSDGQQSTNITFFCFVDIGGIVAHHCLNFLLFC